MYSHTHAGPAKYLTWTTVNRWKSRQPWMEEDPLRWHEPKNRPYVCRVDVDEHRTRCHGECAKLQHMKFLAKDRNRRSKKRHVHGPMVDWDLENKLVEPASASWENKPRVKMCQNVVREAQILAQRCRDVTLGREHDEGRDHDAQHRASGRRLNARRQHRAGQETNENKCSTYGKQARTACTACTSRAAHIQPPGAGKSNYSYIPP